MDGETIPHWIIDQEASLRLRPAQPDDELFLYEVVSSTVVEVYATGGGDRSQIEPLLKIQYQSQKSTYQERYPQAHHYIIQVQGEDSGRLYINFGNEEIRILDITLLPRFRNQGYGSKVLREMQRTAGEQGLPLSIYIEEGNPSLNLFSRLGFHCVGKWEPVHHLLEWRSA